MISFLIQIYVFLKGFLFIFIFIFSARGAKAGIVVFSSTDRESFNNLSRFLFFLVLHAAHSQIKSFQREKVQLLNQIVFSSQEDEFMTTKVEEEARSRVQRHCHRAREEQDRLGAGYYRVSCLV